MIFTGSGDFRRSGEQAAAIFRQDCGLQQGQDDQPGLPQAQVAESAEAAAQSPPDAQGAEQDGEGEEHLGSVPDPGVRYW